MKVYILQENIVDKLIQFLKELQTDKKYREFEEASIKQAIVLKILFLLGWDPFDANEIQPEYMTKMQKIDFAIRQNDTVKAFLIVRKDLENFKANIESLLESAEKADVKIAIFTNGLSWWFFLPSVEGNIDDKRFWSIDHKNEKLDMIAKKLFDFLSKESVIRGNAVKLAEEICNKRKEVMLINTYLPKAWEKVINEPEKYLVDIISEVTNELCGYKPKREKVVEFVKTEEKIRFRKSEYYEINDLTTIASDKSDKTKAGYKGKAIKSFNLKGIEYSVKSWQELPWELCNTMVKNHRESFENVLYISVKGRDYFSDNPYQFIMNKEISGTGIYVNTDLSEAIAIALCNEILKLFSYEESDLSINAK
jgi:predicted type IV restriction endonuclease